MDAIHPDIAVLEKYFQDVVPKNVEENVTIHSEIPKVDAYFI